MKKIKNLFRKLREKVAVIGTTAMGTLILAETRVFAASNTESIDSFIKLVELLLLLVVLCLHLVGKEKMLKVNQEV